MNIRKRIPLFIIFLFFLSCKKNNNTDIPSVQITSPSGLITYNVFDTIKIQAHVSDASNNLTAVNVCLTTNKSTPATANAPVTVTSNSMNFSLSYLINDIHLASGNYYVTVSASNGTNTGYAYEEIYINAVPLKRTAVYAITRSGTSTQAWKLDSALHSSLSITEPGNFIASDVNSYYQQLYMAAYDTGNVNAIGVPIGGNAWSVTGKNVVGPYFTNVYSYGDAAYVSFYNSGNGYLAYYNHAGVQQNLINVAAGYYPAKMLIWNNYIFVEEKNVAPPTENITLYYITGTGYQQASLPGPVIAMYGQDNDHIFVFGNNTSGSPYMQQYRISGNLFYSPISLPAAKLLSVAQVDANTYLLGFSNSTIYLYTWNPNNLTTFITGVNASHIRYDAATNVLVVTDNKIVNQYSYTGGGLMYSATLPDSVLDIQVLYNK